MRGGADRRHVGALEQMSVLPIWIWSPAESCTAMRPVHDRARLVAEIDERDVTWKRLDDRACATWLVVDRR
jgi:hypothetical protein